MQAMNKEINSIEKNDTWELVKLSKGKKCVCSSWVYKMKYNSDGVIEMHKARLVAKGFTQRYGINYEEKLLHLYLDKNSKDSACFDCSKRLDCTSPRCKKCLLELVLR